MQDVELKYHTTKTHNRDIHKKISNHYTVKKKC